MVLRTFSRRKAIRRKRIGVFALILGAILIFSAFAAFLVSFLNEGAVENSVEQGWEAGTDAEQGAVQNSDEKEDEKPKKIDFQPVIDAFVARTGGGNRSVLIYDLEREEVAGAYNLEEDYNTASLYKLFVVYEGYRRVQNGTWDGTARAGSTGRTVLECLDAAIRSSDSPCAETLWAMIGQGELDRIIAEDFGIVNSKISGLVSNAEDIAKIMRRFYEHPEITDVGLVERMFDSMLNQPVTTYDWRQGLPRGFTRAKVYNKVGWNYTGEYWSIYHDAAIVEFEERHFIVVVLTNKVSPSEIKRFGAEIEETIKYLF